MRKLVLSSFAVILGATSLAAQHAGAVEVARPNLVLQTPDLQPVFTDGPVTLNLKRCTTNRKSFSGFGNACPQAEAVADGLCSLSPEFNGGTAYNLTCNEVPGAIPAPFFVYTLTYQCTRPEPCRY